MATTNATAYPIIDLVSMAPKLLGEKMVKTKNVVLTGIPYLVNRISNIGGTIYSQVIPDSGKAMVSRRP